MKIDEQKKSLRKQMIEKRNAFDRNIIEQKSRQILSKIGMLDAYQKARVILAYMNIGNEVITSDLIKKSIDNGKAVYLPIVLKDQKKLAFYRIFDIETDLRQGSYGILEPNAVDEHILNIKDIDLIFIPGVAFDINKNRLGYGAGYYDGFLKQVSGWVKKIGVAFDFQIFNEIPSEDFDIKMDMIVTEERIVK